MANDGISYTSSLATAVLPREPDRARNDVDLVVGGPCDRKSCRDHEVRKQLWVPLNPSR